MTTTINTETLALAKTFNVDVKGKTQADISKAIRLARKAQKYAAVKAQVEKGGKEKNAPIYESAKASIKELGATKKALLEERADLREQKKELTARIAKCTEDIADVNAQLENARMFKKAFSELFPAPKAQKNSSKRCTYFCETMVRDYGLTYEEALAKWDLMVA